MNSFQNNGNNENNTTSQSADQRFRRSLGYENDSEYENAESTTQFYVQKNSEEQSEVANLRFQKSLGYVDSNDDVIDHTPQFRAQNSGEVQNEVGETRFQKSLGYSVNDNVIDHMPQFRAQSGSEASPAQSARMQRSMSYSSVDEYPTFGVSTQTQSRPEPEKGKKSLRKKISLRKGRKLSLKKAEPEQNNPTPPPVIDDRKDTSIVVTNQKRRSQKKLINGLIKLIKVLCGTSPITVMLLYAQPLALISEKTHVVLLILSVILMPLMVVAKEVVDSKFYSCKTTGRVVSYEQVRRSNGEDGSYSIYPTELVHDFDGQSYIVKTTLNKEPFTGQLLHLCVDPEDPCDGKTPTHPLFLVMGIIGAFAGLAIPVYIILSWEAAYR